MEATQQLDRFASLRAHKALPRKRVVSDSRGDEKAPRTSNTRTATDPEVAKSNEISMWIQRSSEVIANPNHHLPLTPPQLPQDEDSQASSAKDQSSTVGDSSAVESTVVPEQRSTPVHQYSPPTPDMTPPRHHASLPLQVPSPLPQERSTRTNSFVTAQEQTSLTNGESVRESDIQRSVVSGLGRGLGLDLDDDDDVTPMADPRIVRELVVETDSPVVADEIVNEDGLFVPEPAAVQEIKIKKRPKRHFTDQPSGFWDGSPSPQAFPESFERTPLVQDESKATREASDIAATYLRQHERRSPALEEDLEMGLLPVDSKRLSQMSATSTIVEALVVDTTPTKRHKLRHTSKVSSLRAANSPLSGSNRSSAHSGDLAKREPPKLHHVTARISSWGTGTGNKRVSLNSDSGISMGADGWRARQKAIDDDTTISPSKVPQRNSSLQGRSKRPPRLVAPAARRSEHGRPSTAPDRTPDPTLQPRHMDRYKARALSESLALMDLAEARRGRSLHKPAPIESTRPSYLSLSPSRDSQRTSSPPAKVRASEHATRHSTHTVPALQCPETPTKELSPTFPQESPGTLRPLSMAAPRTPFSAASLLSSDTPGPYELNEATAVSIYPHTNRSLLVIQQKPGARDAPSTATASASIAGAGVSIVGARVAPAVTIAPQALNALGAGGAWGPPLENPRHAPRAPAVMLIPPTPASGLSAVTTQPARQAPPSLAPATAARAASRPAGAFAALRRSLSARRDPEVHRSASFALRRRSRSVGAGARPTTAEGDGRGGRLGPFWKPRGFWDDMRADDYDPFLDEDDVRPAPDARTANGAGGGGAYVRNTLGLPQLPAIPGPAALARRLGSLKRRRLPNPADRDNAPARDDADAYRITPQGRTAQEPTAPGLVPPWRHHRRRASESVLLPSPRRRVGLGAWVEESPSRPWAKGGFFDPRGLHPLASLQGQIERVREKRVENRLEKQRERLKRNIGPAVLQTEARGF